MPRIVREADIRWEGTVSRGSGVVRAASSGAFELPVTIASRIAEPEGKTSPEELLAAAHATCFVTSLGSELHRAGTPAERIDVHYDHDGRGRGAGAPHRRLGDHGRRCRTRRR